MEIMETVVMLTISVGWGNDLLLEWMFDSHDICRAARMYALEMLNPWMDNMVVGECRVEILLTGVKV